MYRLTPGPDNQLPRRRCGVLIQSRDRSPGVYAESRCLHTTSGCVGRAGDVLPVTLENMGRQRTARELDAAILSSASGFAATAAAAG